MRQFRYCMILHYKRIFYGFWWNLYFFWKIGFPNFIYYHNFYRQFVKRNEAYKEACRRFWATGACLALRTKCSNFCTRCSHVFENVVKNGWCFFYKVFFYSYLLACRLWFHFQFFNNQKCFFWSTCIDQDNNRKIINRIPKLIYNKFWIYLSDYALIVFSNNSML